MLAFLTAHDPPLLFDLEADPSEHYPLVPGGETDIPALLERIKKVKERFEASMLFGESQIGKGSDPQLEPCCSPQCRPKPHCCQCWRLVTTVLQKSKKEYNYLCSLRYFWWLLISHCFYIVFLIPQIPPIVCRLPLMVRGEKNRRIRCSNRA